MNQTLQLDHITAAEAKSIEPFLKVVNEVIRDETNRMSERTALKFLISRKFDLHRALELYQTHEITRLREGLTNIDPNNEDLKVELNGGKFTIFECRDPNNSAIALFTAKLHTSQRTPKNSAQRKKIHQTTLQGIVYQLDSALEDIETQKNGIVFIYNMSESDYSNFDYELCQKILNLLKGAYPAKLKKVLIVSPPIWFKAPFHLLRLIVREKLRDRVWLISKDQLQNHIASDALTPELGGNYQHDHQKWIHECNASYKTRFNDLCDPSSAQSLIKSSAQKSLINFGLQSVDNLIGEPISDQMTNSNGAKQSTINRDGKQSCYDYDEIGHSLTQFLDLMKEKGRSGLSAEYEAILDAETPKSYRISMSQTNMRKNRYTNVLCYDHTRVVLEPYDLPDGYTTKDPMDYINASYIDGYRQSKAYISTQGPVESTFIDFWRMMWQTSSRVIVMVTLNEENNIIKCDRYWPSSNQRVMVTGVYKVEYMGTENHDDFVITNLKLTNTRSKVSRDLWHLQFISWPDFGTPSTALALLKFRESVLKKQLDAIGMTCGTYPPIVVHCSAGVGRSGTFVTIDICIQKMEITGLFDVESIVKKLREQRYLSIQTKDQYIFCYKALLEYATSCGLLSGEDYEYLFSYKREFLPNLSLFL